MLQGEEKLEALTYSSVFVLPSYSENFGIAVLEAMACGLPVVTSTKCGAAELVLEHDAGFVCPASDIESLAWHMTTLTDAEARATLGARAREAVLRLTPSAMTLQLVLLYRDLLAAAHAAGTQVPRKPAPRPEL
jgi:UDP-glucose:(heptosyl)LPS alpha-1,3-glucosyltransferase